MDLSKIIISPKLSKYEWDMHRYHLLPSSLIRKYKREGVDVDRVMDSHKRQKQSLKAIQKVFKKSNFLMRHELSQNAVARAHLVISLGGDNHFQFVSHFVRENLMIGINSDPRRSEGVLNSLVIQEAELLARRVEQDDFKVEEWARIQVVLNGKMLPLLAVSEVFMGESFRTCMSRHILGFRGHSEEQKCSGLLVSTGAGSTGWYDSACRMLHPKGHRFSKTSKFVQFLATEPYHGRLSGHQFPCGRLEPREKLSVRSLNDTTGILSIDSEKEYPFREGDHALLAMGNPLRVLKL